MLAYIRLVSFPFLYYLKLLPVPIASPSFVSSLLLSQCLYFICLFPTHLELLLSSLHAQYCGIPHVHTDGRTNVHIKF